MMSKYFYFNRDREIFKKLFPQKFAGINIYTKVYFSRKFN